jgi:hypothetical protein
VTIANTVVPPGIESRGHVVADSAGVPLALPVLNRLRMPIPESTGQASGTLLFNELLTLHNADRSHAGDFL